MKTKDKQELIKKAKLARDIASKDGRWAEAYWCQYQIDLIKNHD